MGISLHAGGSFSGWNGGLNFLYRIRNFEPYLGPQFSLSRGLPGSSLSGFHTGLNFLIPSSRSWLISYPQLDYQFHFFPKSAKAEIIQELHLSFGFRFLYCKRFFSSIQMGFGGYLQSTFVETENRRKSLSGYNTLLQIQTGVNF